MATTHQLLLDQVLITETYENRSIKYIVDDFVANWLPAGITGNNVSTSADMETIDFIQFDYARPTDSLRDLADMIGFDFWIDADKDLHFVPKGTDVAPFELNDTNGKYKYRSLTLKKSDKQIKNTIIVEGADYVGDSTTDKIDDADGVQKSFDLPYRYDKKPTITVGASAQTVGLLFIDDPASFDCLWGRTEKVIVFNTAPASGAIEATGDPLIPLLLSSLSPSL